MMLSTSEFLYSSVSITHGTSLLVQLEAHLAAVGGSLILMGAHIFPNTHE